MTSNIAEEMSTCKKRKGKNEVDKNEENICPKISLNN
jgi:hypothetical protein